MSPTCADRFGKDHWSMLAYVETLCVDATGGLGVIDGRRVRCNPDRHPNQLASPGAWQDRYSTRLAGFFDFDDRNNPQKATEAGLMILGHDDWDCLEDLEAAGYVDVISLTSGGVKMTEEGSRVSGLIRAHKAAGGHFAGFRLPTPASASSSPSPSQVGPRP